jgi:diacylglycerol kinase (ATP)
VLMLVAVVAHGKKTFGGGLAALRAALAEAGVAEPLWHEVDKGKKAAAKVRDCVEAGAEVVIVWGGDGTVRAAIDALVAARARKVALAIAPAGTANSLASNLGISRDVEAVVELALRGRRRRIDVGMMNGEPFAVMAGAGFDGLMIRDANRKLKRKLGRAAYFWTGLKNLGARATRARVDLDGRRWFRGPATCVLVGNVGGLLAGIRPFPNAEPDDGLLDVGVVQAESRWEWIKVLARARAGTAEGSPLVSTARARKIDVRLDAKRPFEIDGADRPPAKRFELRVKRRAVTVCVP